MLLLGVIQAQAAGLAPAGAGSFDLLQTEVLSGSQASVTFGSLGDYAGVYQHLQIRTATRNANAVTTAGGLYMQFNADTGSNYRWHRIFPTSPVSGVNSQASASTTSILAGLVTSNSSTANAYTPAVIDILDPFETTKNTTIRNLSGDPVHSQVQFGSGAWFNTNALTEIKFYSDANFLQYSRFSLYGWKA